MNLTISAEAQLGKRQDICIRVNGYENRGRDNKLHIETSKGNFDI